MTTRPSVSLRSVAALFVRLGVTAFGGPAAHVAMMHLEVVQRRRWMKEQAFLDNLGLTAIIPGPNSTELAMLVGRAVAGYWGLIIAGAGFIVPAAAIVGAVASLYDRYGDTRLGEAALYGIEPVVIAIVVHALISLGRRALRGIDVIATALVSVALYLAGVNELVALFGAALLVLTLRLSRPGLHAAASVVVLPLAGDQVTLDRLFLVFLKVGALLYGSGYVLLAFLQGDIVERLGWLTEQQLLDAVAIGQFTPGPLFTSATFIGYVLAGWPGAVVATAGIFLPSFLLATVVGHIAPMVRDRWWTAALLDGVNAAAVGLMAGVTWQLFRNAITDVPTALLSAGAFALLVRFRLNSAWLVLGGAVVGLALVFFR